MRRWVGSVATACHGEKESRDAPSGTRPAKLERDPQECGWSTVEGRRGGRSRSAGLGPDARVIGAARSQRTEELKREAILTSAVGSSEPGDVPTNVLRGA
jgi:hypothetical protein